jgi:hypothetical protein
MSDVRKEIIETYAQWTAMSALRSGAPIKPRRDVYTALRGVNFDVLFDEELRPLWIWSRKKLSTAVLR